MKQKQFIGWTCFFGSKAFEEEVSNYWLGWLVIPILFQVFHDFEEYLSAFQTHNAFESLNERKLIALWILKLNMWDLGHIKVMNASSKISD